MSTNSEAFTIGVEEEYQIIDPATRHLRSRAAHVLSRAQAAIGDEVQPELHLSQIETATPICRSLADVRHALVQSRRAVMQAAAKDGDWIASAGTHPFSSWEEQQITPKVRYQGLAADYQQLAREQIIFGCHVHIGIRDPEMKIQVLNRARNWLAPILALASNSPFWQGTDSGYASYRTELWARWPISGPPPAFASFADYSGLLQALIDTGSLEDATKIYWDIRIPERTETLEFRVTDASSTVDGTVMIAGLVRALTRTCYEQAIRNEPFPAAHRDLLHAAHWRAARHGVEEDLIDVTEARAVPATELIERFLSLVRPALEQEGDWEEISSLVGETLRGGTGAMRQRQAYQQAGRMEDVVDLIVTETARGVVSD